MVQHDAFAPPVLPLLKMMVAISSASGVSGRWRPPTNRRAWRREVFGKLGREIFQVMVNVDFDLEAFENLSK
jgi:hypothetical protein